MPRETVRLFLAAALLAASAVIGIPVAALAEGRVLHSPPSESELPAPGQPLELAARVQGKKEVGMSFRTVAVIDGQIMQVMKSTPSFADNNDPIFKIELPSPLTEISYEFLVSDPSGAVLSSERYRVRRSCLPQIRPIVLNNGANEPVPARMMTLVKQAETLSGELESYDRVFDLIDKISEHFSH